MGGMNALRLPAFFENLGHSNVILSDGVIEYAKTHEELKGAFLTFQKDADQIYPGWKEKLGYTGESSVQAASFDWQKKAAAATFATHTMDQAPAFYYEKDPHSLDTYWADQGYFADGTSLVKCGNALFAGHEQGADKHVSGSALPKSKYIADVGYFADGQSVVKVGNALFEGHDQGADPHVSGSPLPPSEYVNQREGCLADGTAMGKVGNDLVH